MNSISLGGSLSSPKTETQFIIPAFILRLLLLRIGETNKLVSNLAKEKGIEIIKNSYKKSFIASFITVLTAPVE